MSLFTTGAEHQVVGAIEERTRIRALIMERIVDHNREAAKTPIDTHAMVRRATVTELTSLLDEIGT